MRIIGKPCYYIFISFAIVSCTQIDDTVKIKKLDNYPSGSSIEYIGGKLYLVGDDATNILILDTAFNVIDSIPLLPYPGKRIPKDIKSDIESSALNGDDLYLFGSGSLPPYRNLGLKHNLKTKENDSIDLEPLYRKAKESGIEQINIEGSCFVQEKLILINRGNKGYPHNHLIITDGKLLKKDSRYQIKVIPFQDQKDTASFKGISGVCYSKESDKLILTVSTENTSSNYEDGTIGKSYLWIVNSFSTKLNEKTIKRNRLIDLEYIDARFKGQKIESAAIIMETDKLIYLVLVADNDDGSSTIFKMSINKTTSHSE